jgi:hypothetical protein
MKRSLAIVLLAMILLVTGCQQTPENVPVVGKARDFLEGVKEIPFQPYKAPSSIDESEQISGLDLKMDAEVTVPDTDGYSVMEVSKDIFDVDTFKEAMDYFRPDATWVKQPILTKADIIQRIADINNSEGSESAETQEYLQQLQELLKEAPEEARSELFSFDEIGNDGNFYAYYPNRDNGTYSVLAGQLNSNGYQYRRDSDVYWVREKEAETDQEKKDISSMSPDISLEEAQKTADQALHDLNADPHMLLSSCTKSIFYKNEKATSAAWEFCYMRDCNGLQASRVGDWSKWKGSPDPVNAAPWSAESIIIIVDEKGIAHFDTRGAGRQKNVLYDNVKLMAFDDILERIKQQLVYNHAYQEESMEENSVTVHEIKLVSSLVNIKDRPDVGRLIPTWDVVYDFCERFEGEKEPFVYHCHTYLNAIDGSYIEPRTDVFSIQ